MPRRRTRKKQRGGVRYVALDCEMVQGERGSMLAEVAVVDYDGTPVYHAYVQPTGPVVNYRTEISGITPELLTAESGAVPFDEARSAVRRLLQGAVLVGHALDNDLRVLRLQHPAKNTRNSAKVARFQTIGPKRELMSQRLATLYHYYTGEEIQQGAHGALEDARASMRLFRLHESEWFTPVRHAGPFLLTKYNTNFPALG